MFVDDLLEFIDNFPPSPKYELKFVDYSIMRQSWITDAVVDNADAGVISDRLERFTPEFRAFILEAARLICEASEGDNETPNPG